MSIKLKPEEAKSNRKNSFLDLTKAISAAIPLVLSADPSGTSAAVSAAMPSILDSLSKLRTKEPDYLSQSAWKVVRLAYSAALIRLFSNTGLERQPQPAELEIVIAAMLQRAHDQVLATPQQITIDCLYSPLKLNVFRDAANRIPHELKPFQFQNAPLDMRKHFEECLVEGFEDVRNSIPKDFSALEASLSGALSVALEKRQALSRHHEYIITMFSQKPIFGQEDTGITLSDLYVRQRAIWNTKEEIKEKSEKTSERAAKGKKNESQTEFFEIQSIRERRWRTPLHVADLHGTLHGWLKAPVQNDAIRVVAGGPGSGKSTFAKAFAVECIDQNTYDVIFVPLQEIEAFGTFESRIENLFRNRTDLGLDRVDSPLKWLGQRAPSGSAPTKPLLIVCDGLDEIAPPGSSEAATVTTDFIQAMGSWINSRNSGGLYVCAIVLGRTISAQEAFRKLGIDHSALIRVGGLLPIVQTDEWKFSSTQTQTNDADKVADIDQRIEYWGKWCRAMKSGNLPMPAALEEGTDGVQEFRELTTEPLLLYLLIWTGYLGEKWKEAADNRNHVYEAIFRQVHARQWGDGIGPRRPNHDVGGHSVTSNLPLDDFFLLQEALGLASWGTGGRTVSSETFASVLKIFLNPDKYDDLSENVGSSLKSVALQSYTKSVGADNAGFEFVHKTLGEYLIARGLVRWLRHALSSLKERTSDSRCAEAAAIFAKLAWHGPFTSEIFAFFRDELRLQYAQPLETRHLLSAQFVPLIGWAVRNGMPTHLALPKETTFTRLELSEHRSLDVLWTAMQCLAHQAFPTSARLATQGQLSWAPGPVKIEWGSAYGFYHLLSRVCSRTMVAENKRIPSFDYVDIEGQAVTDWSYGSVVFSDADEEASVRPITWLPLSIRGANLTGATFYSSHLASADFRGSVMREAVFSGAALDNARFDDVDLTKVVFLDARLRGISARSSKCVEVNFSGAIIERADFGNALMDRSTFDRMRYNNTHPIPAIISETNFEDATFINCDFGRLALAHPSLKGTFFQDCDLSNSTLIGVDLSESKIHNLKITREHQKGTKISLNSPNGIILARKSRPKKPKNRKGPEREFTTILLRLRVPRGDDSIAIDLEDEIPF